MKQEDINDFMYASLPTWRKDQLIQENKTYSDCTDVEQYILNEYSTWKKSDSDITYKLSQLSYWRERAQEKGIQHLL